MADRTSTTPSDDERYRLIIAEGTLAWARYTIMVSINTVVIGFAGFLLREPAPRHSSVDTLGALAAILGLALCVFWYMLVDHGWRLQQLLAAGTVYDTMAARAHSEALRRYALAVVVAFGAANAYLIARGWLHL